jgi:hypothetical protein
LVQKVSDFLRCASVGAVNYGFVYCKQKSWVKNYFLQFSVGICMIVFGLSTFLGFCFALMLKQVMMGSLLSNTILQLHEQYARSRFHRHYFVSSSNELSAFESGVTAK